MYYKHGSLTTPADENIKIWRYMDLTKLLYLLEESSLYFTRSDLFEDPFEGTYTHKTYSAIDDKYKNNNQGFSSERMYDVHKRIKSIMHLNCWHISNFESAAMWSIYLKSGEGIAVQSTFKKLCSSITDKKVVFIGEVQYVDYDKELISDDNAFNPFFYKRLSFAHEKELRCISMNVSEDIAPDGINISVDLPTLIECIYISPTSDEWVLKLIKKVLSRYSLNCKIIKSTLTDKPFELKD